MPHCIKPEIIVYHLCLMALNRTLSPKFAKRRKFASHFKAKSHKRNHVKKDLPMCIILRW